MTTTYLAYIPSPSQGVWHIWIVPLRAYALFIIMGIVAALIIGNRRWVARGGQAGVIYDIALWAVPFGLIGGRLYHVMTDWRTYFGDDGAGLLGALKIWDGGLGIWGAVALGGLGAWIGCRQKGIPLPAFADAIAPGIILAQAIGRLGNYFNQELYGRPTTLPWGLEIYERRDASGALDTLNGSSTGQLIEVVHPTFLYELLWNLLIFAALIYIDRRFKIGHGRLFAMYVAGYCLGRFWVELMRSDVATHIAGIRINSFTSTFVFIGAVVYIMVAPKGREAPASLVGKPLKGEHHEDAVETFAKELTAIAATTGVVAAAKVASDAEDDEAKPDDAKPDDAKPDDAEAKVEKPDEPAATAAEAEAEPQAGQEAVELEPEAGLGSVDGEEAAEAVDAAPEVHEAEVEAADKAEAVAGEVAAESDEPAEPGGESEAEPQAGDEAVELEPEAGLGSVDGEEAAEAVDAAPEVHEAEVEAADKAEAVAGEVAAESDEKPQAGDEAVEPEAAAGDEPRAEPGEQPEIEEEPKAESKDEDEAPKPETGLGPVEGREAVDTLAAAPEAHKTELEAADEAEPAADEVVADDIDKEPEEREADHDSEPDEPETADAAAAVEEAGPQPSEEEAAKEAEAVAHAADTATEDEPKTGVLEAANTTPDEPEPTEDAEKSADSGESERSEGRLSRWLRRNR